LSDILKVVDTLNTWLEYWLGINSPSVVSGNQQPPSLASILKFTQVILDAHFVSLIQDVDARPGLDRLTKHLRSHLEILGDFRDLIGPLSALARAQKALQEQKPEVKSKRVLAHELSMTIGNYTIELFDL